MDTVMNYIKRTNIQSKVVGFYESYQRNFIHYKTMLIFDINNR